jgi:hypothetical protein
LYASARYYDGDETKEDELDGTCSMYGETNAFKTLAVVPEEKIDLGKPKIRWVDNIKMDLKEMGCKCVNCIRIGTSDELL